MTFVPVESRNLNAATIEVLLLNGLATRCSLFLFRGRKNGIQIGADMEIKHDTKLVFSFIPQKNDSSTKIGPCLPKKEKSLHKTRGRRGPLSVTPFPKSSLKNKQRMTNRRQNLEVIDMPPRLDIDAKRVVELYRGGFSTRRIGRMLGCSKVPVLRRLHEPGIKLRGKRINVDVERMIKLYKRGFTSWDVARAINCSKNTVLRRLRESEVKLRSNTQELPDLKPCRDLAYVLGVTFGDGKRSGGLHLWVKDGDFAEAFAEACENLGFNPRRYFKENERTYEICTYSIWFGRWLKSLSHGGVNELLTDEEAKKAFVRGYFNSDGYATISSIEECRNNVMFGDPNLSLLRLVTEVCSDLGIKTSIYGPHKNSSGLDGKKDMRTLYVHVRSRRRFAELVKSSLARKQVPEKIARFYS